MMSLTLSVALLSSSGGLLAERLPSGVRLLDSPTVAFGTVLGASAGDEKQRSLEAMTRGELEVERLRLLDAQPSFAPGLIVAGAGVAAVIVGAAVLAVPGQGGTLIGILFVAGGLAAIVTGAVLLIIAAVRGPAITSQLRRVEQRINTILQQQGDTSGGDAPPPPPPPPPGALRDLPQPPQVLLATF